MATIRLRLNSHSIAAAIRKVNAYKDGLEVKAKRIREMLAKVLQAEAEYGFNGAPYDVSIYGEVLAPDITVNIDDQENVSVVYTDDRNAFFIEYGAGVYYNPDGAPHPAGREGIYKIGEYGQGYGKQEVWAYRDENGEWRKTHGTPMSMPFYLAAQAVRRELPDIVKAVFKEGSG